MAEALLNTLNKKIEKLLSDYSELKLRNKELLIENNQLHDALATMRSRQVTAGNKVMSLVSQLKAMQE